MLKNVKSLIKITLNLIMRFKLISQIAIKLIIKKSKKINSSREKEKTIKSYRDCCLADGF